MKIMAVICEYNPFHKGHAYQLQTHRKTLSADGVVCLMSGNFVQRGAPAMFDKWTRAKAAVCSGADLVLELPVVYAAQSAMRFANGAVSLLDALGCIDVLSFGSECGDLQKLQDTADILFSKDFSALLADELKKGTSYPAARSAVFKVHFPNQDASLLETPNNILALEYLASLKRRNSQIKPATLLRNFAFASASQIRERIEKNEDVSSHIPATATWNTLPYDKVAFDQMVSYQFLRETPKTLKTIADVAEGLENRILKYAKLCYGAESIAQQVNTKRYTKTRIDRIIINTLLGITDQDTELAPQYARVLAFNDCGTKILNKMAKTTTIPIITKTADAVLNSKDAQRMFEKDVLATDVYALMTQNKQAGQDYKTSPIYIKE